MHDKLEPSRVYLEHEEAPAVLKVILRQEFERDHPLIENVEYIQFGHREGHWASMKMKRFDGDMAAALSEVVKEWYVSPKASGYEGVRILADPGDLP